MKKTLLDKSDPKYAKRLIRVLNQKLRAGESIYVGGSRSNEKVLQVGGCLLSARIIVKKASDYRHESFDTDAFYDHTGQQICASRC